MSELGLDRFVAKIGFDNEASLSLFSGLGFTEGRYQIQVPVYSIVVFLR